MLSNCGGGGGACVRTQPIIWLLTISLTSSLASPSADNSRHTGLLAVP